VESVSPVGEKLAPPAPPAPPPLALGGVRSGSADRVAVSGDRVRGGTVPMWAVAVLTVAGLVVVAAILLLAGVI
jgi:hypothetical protein